MSAHRKRMSVSSTGRAESPFAAAPNPDTEAWVGRWTEVLARDLIDSPVVSVDADVSVEEACDLLLTKDIGCLAVRQVMAERNGVGIPLDGGEAQGPFHGLFDFSDVNAFLTLAATRHKLPAEEIRAKPGAQEILDAARAGKVPVHLVSNMSEKNPMETLPHDATVLSLLAVFARGAHRVLIRRPEPLANGAGAGVGAESADAAFLGFVSDRALLAWLMAYANETPSLHRFLAVSLSLLALPSLNLYRAVVAAAADESVLDAMTLMSAEGVSSVAVVDDEGGGLLSAVSVTDIGKIVVPAQSNQILSAPLKQFIAMIKEPDGSTDGVDKCPVYSVNTANTLLYTMQKLLATNSHRLFVTDDVPVSSSPSSSTMGSSLCGIVSVVDVLSLFAKIANIPDVDPTRMKRHRRASSSASSHSYSPPHSHAHAHHAASRRSSMSSMSGGDLSRSRSGSRTSLGRVGSVGSLNLSMGVGIPGVAKERVIANGVRLGA